MCTLPSVSPQARRWPVEHQRSLDIATSSCSVSKGTWEGEKKRKREEEKKKRKGESNKKGGEGGGKEEGKEEKGGEEGGERGVEEGIKTQLAQIKKIYNQSFSSDSHSLISQCLPYSNWRMIDCVLHVPQYQR